MQLLSIPTCYFPSTALFLDDNRDFLLNFVLQLDEGLAYRIFNEPHRALDYIQNKQGKLGSFSHHTGQEPPKIASIHKEIYNPNRFNETSVLIVDYAMPGMNGIEFCRRIENKFIKKILLTGQADERQAIDAFNQGLIHCYIKKSDMNAVELITKSILQLQLQYFQAMSDSMARVIPEQLPDCLQDDAFVNFFQKLCYEHGIVEYYLLDPAGSFLLMDDDANMHFLFVKNEASIRGLYEFAKLHSVDKELLENISSGKLISTAIPGKSQQDWASIQQLLSPAARLHSEQTFYYAFLQSNDLFDFRQHKVLSYHRYLDELDAEELLTG